MAIIRRGAREPFTIIPNATIEDPQLDFQTLGMLTYLLSKPDNWRLRVGDLRKRGLIGRDKAYVLINTLIKAGYVQKTDLKDEGGRMLEVEYLVFDRPRVNQDESPLPENQEVDSQKQVTPRPLPDLPDPVNQEHSKKGLITNTSSLRSEDAGASESVNARFWKECLPLLKTQNPTSPEAKLRALIGKWLKRAGGDADGLLKILDTCIRSGTMDAVSYLTKAINENYTAPETPDNFSDEKWATIAKLVMDSGTWDDSLGPAPWRKGCRMPRKFVTPEFMRALGADDNQQALV